MDFIDQLKQFANRLEKTKANILTEEATKTSMIMPFFQMLGYDVCPKPDDFRSDIIQAVKLGSPEAVIAFCKGIQAASPIDSHVSPEPWDMPGYEDPVIMAAGAFVQGSSIELSADAPIREPYVVYFQGGLTYEHSRFGVTRALQELCDKGLIILR